MHIRRNRERKNAAANERRNWEDNFLRLQIKRDKNSIENDTQKLHRTIEATTNKRTTATNYYNSNVIILNFIGMERVHSMDARRECLFVAYQTVALHGLPSSANAHAPPLIRHDVRKIS